MVFIGLDAGSVSIKLALLDEAGNRLQGYYERHKGHPHKVAYELLKKAVSNEEITAGQGARGKGQASELRTPNSGLFSLSVTGSAGKLIASVLHVGFTNELVAQAYATKRLYPQIKTIFELGGEDSKLIFLNEGVISDFSMNSVCAAGTGSFLDQQAERLRLTIEEFSELALKSKRPSRIAGRCSVFAKSDMIHLQQIATPMEDIVAGLCFAVARNFRGSIVRGRPLTEPVSFHGGVAANKGMVRAFREVFDFKDFFVPQDHALIGAIGAALKDMDEGVINRFELDRLKTFFESSRLSEAGHKPLISKDDDFFERHRTKEGQGANAECEALSAEPNPKSKIQNPKLGDSELRTPNSGLINAYLGIDIGSISTNLAVIDKRGNLLAKRYLMTAGRPIDAVRQGLQEIGDEVGDYIQVSGVGTTGSGRYMIADYVGADIVKNEITAQATAAAFIDPGVDTIFEIGGQDSKFISMRSGVIVDFEMNKACAAGTGSFLEEQAEKLDISIKDEFADCACAAGNPCRLGERCTVFMENSLMANLQKGSDKDDLLAGLAYSIVQNYINKVVAGKHIGSNIFFQGGVAFNKSVVAAFEKYLNREIKVPPNHDVTGAIGMALIAMKQMEEKVRVMGHGSWVMGPEKNTLAPCPLPLAPKSSFKGFGLSKRPYQVTSFECKACSNVCEINRVRIEGEDGFLFYGGRCEKYDIKRNKGNIGIPDLFKFREDMLWEKHLKYSAECGVRSAELNPKFKTQNPKPKIGLPYIFSFHDYLPFWSTLLWELGFEVEVSPKTNREIIDIGAESVLADTCFPVKVAHGHIKYLVDKGTDLLFIPSFVSVNSRGDEYDSGSTCPLTQTIPYAARIAHPSVKILAPVIDFKRPREYFTDELLKVFRPFGIKRDSLLRVISSAEKAQEVFTTAISEKGEEILNAIDKKTVVVIGRPYNSFDSGVNLGIPRKLADIGMLSMPLDFLPAGKIRISDRWPNMYWKSGQRILKAARFIRNHPLLYAVYIGNFSCGPDSFILKFFEEEMKGKPFLHLEIDEHSADAGAITRCEAFLDSIENYKPAISSQPSTLSSQLSEAGSQQINPKSKTQNPKLKTPNAKLRTVFIPRMSDHAFALAAAFERCGVAAEVLPESDRNAIDIGRKFVSGKECYPCTVTTGDMVKKVFSPDFSPEGSVFFMPSGSGPCRFGQYNVFHKLVLEELGLRDVPVLSPNQDVGFYKELGIVGKNFSRYAWDGLVAYELLCKCLHETRPYEKEKGAADSLYQEYIKRLYFTLRGVDGKVEDLLKRARTDFEELPRHNGHKPLIGIVGEIFVRSNKFSNEDVVRKVEELGGEAWLAPVEEWIYYVNRMSARKALIKKERSAMIQILLKEFFQRRIEHRYSRLFKGFLKTINEPKVKDILKKASPYLHDSFEGEAILSIGKSIDLIEKGASGIINAMPFGCMPGTVVTTLMRGVTRDHGIPFISISYDGSESQATGIQLEAFMNQAKETQVRSRK